MDYVRQIGKYVTITSCIIAVGCGIVNWKYFAPFEISVICWVGLILWITGAAGIRIQKYLAQRSTRETGPR